MRVLINKITELEKLQEDKMQVIKTKGIQQWNKTLWSQQNNPEKKFNFNDYVLKISYTQGSLLGNGLERTKYNMCCQITLCYW